MNDTLILSQLQCEQKIKRIAHQIHETYHQLNNVVIIGIAKRGFELAKLLEQELSQVAEFEIELASLTLDKDNPLSRKPDLSIDIQKLEDKAVVLVDDVLNSGKTLIYSVGFLLEGNPDHIKIATLVDRRHRKYPVRADFVGLTLSTTLKEHISVVFTNNGTEAYLK